MQFMVEKQIGIYKGVQAYMEHVRDEVRGHHKVPCEDCKKPFLKGMYFYKSAFAGQFCSSKHCCGCMGRIVACHVGTEPEVIQEARKSEQKRIDELQEKCQNIWNALNGAP
jgi:hypothetical protein